MTDAESIELAKLEHPGLRRELEHLRWCQIQFFTFAVTSTLIYFGIIVRGGELSVPFFKASITSALLTLLPLVILIPSMWIFFDETKTISRIVGYYIVLERVLLKKESYPNFTGWENGLQIFRKNVKQIEGDAKTIKEKISSIKEIRSTGGSIQNIVLSPRGYIVVVYFVFVVFIAICHLPLVLHILLNLENVVSIAPVIVLEGVIGLFSLFFITYEYKTLKHILFGKYSYLENMNKWIRILEGKWS
jgi:hypothetical protein